MIIIITIHYNLCIPVNYRHTFYHSVARSASENKMTLNNLATVFGPNLLRPGFTSGDFAVAAFDVMSPVNILMFFLTCPEEVYDEPWGSYSSAPNSTSRSSLSKSRKRSGLINDDTTSISSSNSTGFTTVPPQSPPPLLPTLSFSSSSLHAGPATPTSSGGVRYKQSMV